MPEQRRINLHSYLISAAETELGRKLTELETRLLNERFSLSTVDNCVEKVNIYLIGHILH